MKEEKNEKQYYTLGAKRDLKDKKAEIKFAKIALARFKSMPHKYRRDPITQAFIKELQSIIKNRDV